MKSNTGGRLTQIGIDRLVRLQWLDQTAKLVLAGNDDTSIKRTLQSVLRDSFRSDNPDVRGSIDKTITILHKVWMKAPSDLETFRVNGLKLFTRLPSDYHTAIHWGMLTAVYPFWGNVAIQVGRLLRLQGSAAAVQVQRRLREQYGERETVSRRVRYVLRSFLDWTVLTETGAKGIYTSGSSLTVNDLHLTVWLVEASLRARSNGSAPLKELIESPGLFPFRLASPQPNDLRRASTNLDILRQGLDQDYVVLR
jgi:hypothetical protein